MKDLQTSGENVLQFARPGLSDEPPGSGKNWLSRMDQGTRFIAKLKHDAGSTLDDFIVMTDPKTMNVVLLGKNMSARDGVVNWRDPEIFSKDYRFYTILEILETPDGNSDKIPTEPMVSDAQPEVIPSLHEEE